MTARATIDRRRARVMPRGPRVMSRAYCTSRARAISKDARGMFNAREHARDVKTGLNRCFDSVARLRDISAYKMLNKQNIDLVFEIPN